MVSERNPTQMVTFLRAFSRMIFQMAKEFISGRTAVFSKDFLLMESEKDGANLKSTSKWYTVVSSKTTNLMETVKFT